MSIYLDDALPVVKYNGLNVLNATCTLPSATTIGGSAVVALATITSASANALTVGRLGATTPGFNVDASTATSITGLNIKTAASGNGVAVSALGSTNETLTIDAKGTGYVNVGGTSTGLLILGAGGDKVPVTSTTTTNLAAQSGTAAITELLGGIYTHASVTGAGTLTTPTGTLMSGGITGIATGYTFQCVYYNSGTQTVTITAGATGMTILGTAAVPTLKCAFLTFVNTAATTWLCYVNVSA